MGVFVASCAGVTDVGLSTATADTTGPSHDRWISLTYVTNTGEGG